jgi:hypothetical protein
MKKDENGNGHNFFNKVTIKISTRVALQELNE